MTDIQYGLIKLSNKFNDYNKLIRVLVIIKHDIKKLNLSNNMLKIFINLYGDKIYGNNPLILLKLWKQFKVKTIQQKLIHRRKMYER